MVYSEGRLAQDQAGNVGGEAALKVADFDFDLPPDLIAQHPAPERGGSRMLVLDRETGSLTHSHVHRLPDWLREGDVLVVNDTKVFPARLLGERLPGGGAAECVLLNDLGDQRWEALVHPGQRLKAGSRMVFRGGSQVLHVEVLERLFHGRRIVRLAAEPGPTEEAIDAIGHVPLPPYIRRADEARDRDRYQTVYARARGSVAAPTAGLHLSHALLDQLRQRGVQLVRVTLHVGYGTFQPVRVEEVALHTVESERFSIDPVAAEAVNAALHEGRRVIAVGTTTTRALETAGAGGSVIPQSGRSSLFIYPGYRFRIVRGLLTNFHLPRSSLLMLVSAFAGREAVLRAYREAVARRYRFYSYGDAMLLVESNVPPV